MFKVSVILGTRPEAIKLLSRLLLVGLGVAPVLLAGLAGPLRAGEPAAAPPAGVAVLTESSAWRLHVTWGKALYQGASGLKTARLWNGLTLESDPPPEDWMQPAFDDSFWSRWRETHAAGNLKAKDGQDSGVRLYDEWQYGIQHSVYARLRCLRGKFRVEDPAAVKNLSLAVAYRGGVVVYLNGQEIGRGHVPKPEQPDAACPAEAYPDEIYYGPDDKPWRLVNNAQPVPADPAALEKFNGRIRHLTVPLPAAALRKGVNVLALEIHRAPYSEKAGPDGLGWSTCGAVTIELRGEGPVKPAAARPAGLQVWSAGMLTKVSPFGSVTAGRVGGGAGVRVFNFPLSWTGGEEPLAALRLVGTRNGVFGGQVVLSSDAPIKNAKAEPGDLVRTGGAGGRIPASACRVGYMAFPKEPPAVLTDPTNSTFDALYDQPPAEVPVLPEKPQAAPPTGLTESRGYSWCEGGAVMPIWFKVRVPADAAPGDYEGAVTVRADGSEPVTVPVKLTVHGFALPDPKDFVTHVGLIQSPDTLALKYKAPLWSDQHFQLMEKSYALMGEIGGKAAYVYLVNRTWHGNQQGMVYWVKGADGGYKYDFRVLDRCLDLVQKYLKPEVVCLYVYEPNLSGRGSVSLLDPETGKVSDLPTPAYEPTEEAAAFWKPVISEVTARLAKRGLPGGPVLGFMYEGGRGQKNFESVTQLFKAASPEAKWAELAHYGGQKGSIGGVPYGYVMSVCGNVTPYKTKLWGAPDIPFIDVLHFRASRATDLRPFAARGGQYWAAETAMGILRGLGPVGADFWLLTAEERGPQSRPGSVETPTSNLGMGSFTTAAYLAPGPDGPIPTARFEVFRQGLQMCEARTVLEKALADQAVRKQLDPALVKRCEETLAAHNRAFQFVTAGENYAQGEGWKWYESSGWESDAGRLFAAAAEVRAALPAPPAPPR